MMSMLEQQYGSLKPRTGRRRCGFATVWLHSCEHVPATRTQKCPDAANRLAARKKHPARRTSHQGRYDGKSSHGSFDVATLPIRVEHAKERVNLAATREARIVEEAV